MTNAEWKQQRDAGFLAPATMLTKAHGLVKAVLSESKALAKRESSISTEDVQERLGICHGCDQFDNEKSKCSSCGCYMKFKARLRSSHCPKNKW